MTSPARPTTLLLLAGLVATSLVATGGAAVADDTTCFGQTVTMSFGDGDDVVDLTGNPGQVVFTGGGDDEVIGSSGADVVCLGDGKDRFVGSGGADMADGGAGRDKLIGGPAVDTFFGGDGNDVIKGRGGADEGEGGTGNDRIKGGPGDDHLSGGEGDDLIKGGSGNDRLNGGDATTTVVTSGNDTMFGGSGYDRLWSNYGYSDVDPDGALDGGSGYDYCGSGAVQTNCEQDHHYAAWTEDPTQNEWYPLVDEVFTRWGLDQEVCAKHKDADGVKVEMCIGDQRANGVEVLMCESSGWPFAQNGTSGTAGLFQNHPLYWPARVTHLIATYGSGNTLYPEVQFAADFPVDADPFDPRWNVEMAAMLVYENRQTLLLLDPAPDYSYKIVGGSHYPKFDYLAYWKHYFDRWNPVDDPPGTPTEIIYGGYPNGGEGPQPWGQWVSCGAVPTVWPQGQGLYDPGWLSPWENTPDNPNPQPDWWPDPPWPPPPN